ncbi:hypothetical protein E2986_10991 [Frieseomelitta varia]|uniref:Uncharacterized protein n=2 Tax=Frieseomelitta varia TaxID=561572 RepID=A0A833SDC1_9HYME|nr:hypothetical protein E2986_10991 [Frieseomelitta varia]
MKTKRGEKSSGSKDTTVCYKCKNPKNGATYEQCSYHSQPLADSSSIEGIPVAPPGFRNRRSNMDEASSGSRDSGGHGRDDSPYRFSERIFSDATDDVPPEYKNENEKCEKVAKDSMVCMVCRDTRSNAKYEQCSYVGKPNAESSSPETRESEKEGEEYTGRRSSRDYSKSDEPVKEYSSYDDKEVPERSSREEGKESSNTCKKVQRGSKTCTVCKDPGTGGNYERCSYSYEPDDKVYKYSRSKSFGYPSSSSKDNDNKKDYKEDKSVDEGSRSEPEDYIKDYTIPESYLERIQSSPPSYFKDDESRSNPGHYGSSRGSKSPSDEDGSSSGYEKSKLESQRVAESIEPSHCKEIERDSMTCKVCKDPKTGSNSEQCSYKYQPNDKSYSYSKSRSFGSPTEPEERSYDESERKESKEPYESRGYDTSSEKTPRVTNRDASRGEFSTFGESEDQSASSAPKKGDSGFYDAFKKKAEIQQVLREFQKEDRSNCKKLMRGRMTCYQCVDEKGFQKEECAFVTSDEPIGEKSTKKVPRSIERRSYDSFAEPRAAASEKAEREQSNSERRSDEVEKGPKEIEPYEYVAETRPVFDKVLGFTLPAYMLSTSEHEDEFDKIFTSGAT